MSEELIKELVSKLLYDQHTGMLTWKSDAYISPKVRGKQAGSINAGYIKIHYAGKIIRAHRVVWFIENGAWPKNHIDHINRNRSDNRIVNLREVTDKENQKNRSRLSNNTSGVRGVTFNKRLGKWQAQINVDGKYHYLGIHQSLVEAKNAYMVASKTHHREFGRYD